MSRQNIRTRLVNNRDSVFTSINLPTPITINGIKRGGWRGVKVNDTLSLFYYGHFHETFGLRQ